MKKRKCTPLLLLLILVLVLSLNGTVSAAGFSDSEDIGAPYAEAVRQMADRGVLNGFPDGGFYPEATLTREQHRRMIMEILFYRKYHNGI